MDYSDQLTDERWLMRREQILIRDWRMCQHCMSGKNLEVHHKYYIVGRMAWEYDNFYLITLCKACHWAWHQNNKVKVLQEEDPIVGGFTKIARWLKDLEGLSRG